MARRISLKRIAINRAQLTIVIAAGVAAFILAFCMVGAKNMLDQRSYQSRVIGKKKVALSTLKKNQTEYDNLNNSYKEFDETKSNILGGSADGKGDKDGSNTRIVLDALPSKYDFPALTTSLEKIFKENGFPLKEITGSDDEVAQSENSAAPSPVEIPFAVRIEITGQTGTSALRLLERSIRPVQVKKLTLKVEQGTNPELTIEANTYYQPEKKFEVQTEQVR